MKPALVLVLVLAPAIAAAQRVSCPLVLPEGSIEVTHPPAGWLGSSPSLARLGGGGVMSGHPKQMQYLAPAATKKVKNSRLVTWHFDTGEEKWLWCSYGTIAVQIAKRLDDAATECTLTVKEERPGVIADMTVSCKR